MFNNCTEEQEIWKDVPGYEGKYQVSTWGNVKTLRRKWSNRNRMVKERLLCPYKDKDGYLLTYLHKDGKNKKFSIHQLVLIAFVGPCPEGMECRHFPDRNRTNNRLDNLQWSTEKTNQQDRVFHGTDMNGERHWSAKLTNEQAEEILRKSYKM